MNVTRIIGATLLSMALIAVTACEKTEQSSHSEQKMDEMSSPAMSSMQTPAAPEQNSTTPATGE